MNGLTTDKMRLGNRRWSKYHGTAAKTQGRGWARATGALTVVLACGVTTGPADAQSAVTGRLVQVHAANAGNLPFRLYLENAPVLCTGGMSEGYLDDSDANYKVYVQTLLLAMTMGWPVTVYSAVGAYGRCKITYVVVNRQ